MIDVMYWGECERNFIKEVEIDKERVDSIIDKASKRLKRAQNTKIDEETASFVVEDYYEVIKKILIAYLLKNGLRSKNHQCLISYFYKQNPDYEKETQLIFSYFYKQNPDYEKETQLILQMSFFRNRLDYYGEEIPLEFYQKNKEEFENIIKLLKNLVDKA